MCFSFERKCLFLFQCNQKRGGENLLQPAAMYKQAREIVNFIKKNPMYFEFSSTNPYVLLLYNRFVRTDTFLVIVCIF